jgi:predicted nucleic acid-binding protein
MPPPIQHKPRLFLDTSVMLAAIGSAKGASRHLIISARKRGWRLITAEYCEEEVRRNLSRLPLGTEGNWPLIHAAIDEIIPTKVVLDSLLVFTKTKDRPVVISALSANCDWLLTLDEQDFHGKLGSQVYGTRIASPGGFLLEQNE